MLLTSPQIAGPAFQNTILCATGEHDLRTIMDDLEMVPLERGQVLSTTHEAPEYVYFPEGGIISVSVEMDGKRVETGIIGREGISTYGALREGRVPISSSTVQVGGFMAYRMSADRFRAALRRCPDLYDAVHDALYGLMGQIALTAASNARHLLASRVARWLLLCAERLDGRTIPVTHDVLAQVLGAQRSSVTLMLDFLESEKAIRSRRGIVVVTDRNRLRRLAGGV